MNREILFRGKRKDNGELVKGFINYCDFHNAKQEQFREYYIVFQDQYQYEVIPETIGQYTGLKDKNGKMIFEGDIVEYTYIGEDGEKNDYKVKNGVMNFKNNGWHINSKWLDGFTMNMFQFKVIGNIYESKINE